MCSYNSVSCELPNHTVTISTNSNSRLIYLFHCGNMVCPICLDSLVNGESLRVIQCGHPIHRECLAQHYRTSHLCPICRARITRPRRLFLDENVEPFQAQPNAAVNALEAAIQNVQINNNNAERAVDDIVNDLFREVANAGGIIGDMARDMANQNEMMDNIEQNLDNMEQDVVDANELMGVRVEPIVRPCRVLLNRIPDERRPLRPRNIPQRFNYNRVIRPRNIPQRFNYNRLICVVCHRSCTTFDLAINFADFVCSPECMRR